MKIAINQLTEGLEYQQTFLNIMLMHNEIDVDQHKKLSQSIEQLKEFNYALESKYTKYIDSRSSGIASITQKEFYEGIL